MKLKLVIATSLVALGAASAQAQDNNADLTDLTGRSFQWGAGHLGSFLDTVSFSLSTPSQAASSGWYFNGLMLHATYGLYGYGADDLLGTADDVQFGLWSLMPRAQAVTQAVTLNTGRYYYAISGRAIPDAGNPQAVYVLDLNMSPVPEPAPFAMLAAGLTLLGWRAARRRQSQR